MSRRATDRFDDHTHEGWEYRGSRKRGDWSRSWEPEKDGYDLSHRAPTVGQDPIRADLALNLNRSVRGRWPGVSEAARPAWSDMLRRP